MEQTRYSPTIVFFLVTSIWALAFALILEHGFRFEPCKLCIYERWMFFIVFLLSATMLIKPQIIKLFIPMIFLMCFVGILITCYHIGIEKHILTESCGIHYGEIDNIERLYDQITSRNIVRCDNVTTLFGVPLTYLTLSYLCFVNLFGYLLYKKYG